MADLLLDIGGRLHDGERVLPMAPTTLSRAGSTGRGWWVHFSTMGPVDTHEVPLADCYWRETTMESHERQQAMRTCADLSPDGWVCEEHGAAMLREAGGEGPEFWGDRMLREMRQAREMLASLRRTGFGVDEDGRLVVRG